MNLYMSDYDDSVLWYPPSHQEAWDSHSSSQDDPTSSTAAPTDCYYQMQPIAYNHESIKHAMRQDYTGTIETELASNPSADLNSSFHTSIPTKLDFVFGNSDTSSLDQYDECPQFGPASPGQTSSPSATTARSTSIGHAVENLETCIPPDLSSIHSPAILEPHGADTQEFVIALPPLTSLTSGWWKCDVCQRVFRRKQRALAHYLHTHGGWRLLCNGSCSKPQCKKSFASQEGLDVHVTSVSVTCHSCGRGFLKKNIRRHQRENCHPERPITL